MNKCQFCHKDTPNKYFCNTRCSAKYFRKVNYMPSTIEGVIKVLAKVTKGIIPAGALTVLGIEYGYSRERVRQIVKKLGITSVQVAHRRIKIPCVYCGVPFHPIKKGQLLCSDACAKNYHFYIYHEIKICPVCGLGFLAYRRGRSNSSISNPIKGKGQKYCSKGCWGTYWGLHFGWGSRKARGKSARYPKTRESLIKIMGEEFTLEDFKKTFGYRQTYLMPVIKRMERQGLIKYDMMDKCKVL